MLGLHAPQRTFHPLDALSVICGAALLTARICDRQMLCAEYNAVLMQIIRFGDVHHFPQALPARMHLDSYERFIRVYLPRALSDMGVIETGKWEIILPHTCAFAHELGLKYWVEPPNISVDEALQKGLTYAGRLFLQVALRDKQSDEIHVETVMLGYLPYPTAQGDFIVDGTQWIVHAQMLRAPGVYFLRQRRASFEQHYAWIIPTRGFWLRLEERKSNTLVFRMKRFKSMPATLLLKSLLALFPEQCQWLGLDCHTFTDADILGLYQDDAWLVSALEHTLRLEKEIKRSDLNTAQKACINLCALIHTDAVVDWESARRYLGDEFLNPRKYDLGALGRQALNAQFAHPDHVVPLNTRTLCALDIVAAVRQLSAVRRGDLPLSDMEDVGNRLIYAVGEQMDAKLRESLSILAQIVRTRLTYEADKRPSLSTIVTSNALTGLYEVFRSTGAGTARLLEQVNPLSDLSSRRTLTLLGTGGLKRQAAGFEVRDVHYSQYGRICPVETPEGENIGLMLRMANYAAVDAHGRLLCPYYQVKHTCPKQIEQLVGRTLRDTVRNAAGEILAEPNARIDLALAERLSREFVGEELPVLPYISREVVWLSAKEEMSYVIGEFPRTNQYDEIVEPTLVVKTQGGVGHASRDRVDLVPVAPDHFVGVSAGLIPFIEHDESSRALMGSNMQRQAVPLIRPDYPIVGTGLERQVVPLTFHAVVAQADGVVKTIDHEKIVVKEQDGQERQYSLKRFCRTNQNTCLHQRPSVQLGERVRRGQVLADTGSVVNGALTLGQNVVVAFMSLDGYNYEDAIVVSERVLKESKYASIHIEKYVCEVRNTPNGKQRITRDIPNAGEDALANLDETGIIRIGARVKQRDILVGVVSPAPQQSQTVEDRLLRAILGEQSRAVEDVSLRMPHGESGTVIGVEVVTREDNPHMPADVITRVMVYVAQQRPLSVGDKMAGRHGNKGVVSAILPEQEMVFLEDGTPVDVVLNPLGVPGRMNVGQIFEAALGWAAHQMGYYAQSPSFNGASVRQIEAELARTYIAEHAYKTFLDQARKQVQKDPCKTSTQALPEHEQHYINDTDMLLTFLLNQGLASYDQLESAMRAQGLLRRLCLEIWLKQQGIPPQDIYDYETSVRDHSPDEQRRDDNAIALALRLHLSLYAQEITNDISSLTEEIMRETAQEMEESRGIPSPLSGKRVVFDAKTGRPYERPVFVGVMHIMKLIHMVEDKAHARSIGPYSVITQQPLGGRSHFGGQRVGEMEVWALEAYGAAYTLQEMLTVKSDDHQGRMKAYMALAQGHPVTMSNNSSSTQLLIREMQALGLAVYGVTPDGQKIDLGVTDNPQDIQPRTDQVKSNSADD